ncbi:hypothetical protein [Streptomyces sp. NPDC052042]
MPQSDDNAPAAPQPLAPHEEPGALQAAAEAARIAERVLTELEGDA